MRAELQREFVRAEDSAKGWVGDLNDRIRQGRREARMKAGAKVVRWVCAVWLCVMFGWVYGGMVVWVLKWVGGW